MTDSSNTAVDVRISGGVVGPLLVMGIFGGRLGSRSLPLGGGFSATISCFPAFGPAGMGFT